MIRIKPKRISYANGIKDTFWIRALSVVR